MLDLVGMDIDIFNSEKLVAVVGSREAKPKELRRAYSVSKALAKKGFIVVSGLAKGIDTWAHKGALDAGGLTIAIVSTTQNEPIYPHKNADLAEQIKEQGAILYPFEVNVGKNEGYKRITRLIERSRLNGLMCSKVIAVSDSPVIKGGTCYAVNHGKLYGREVYRLDSNGIYHSQPEADNKLVTGKTELNFEWLEQLWEVA